MGRYPSKLTPNYPLDLQLASEEAPEDVTWDTGIRCHSDNTVMPAAI